MKLSMAKQKKKRNKQYKGAEASVTRPTITRVSAVNRNKYQQWWFEKKRIVKPVAIAIIVVLLLSWLIFELVRAIAGGFA